MSELLLLQFLLLFGLSIIFTSISITRQTFISFLLSAILWFITGIANYTLTISVLTMALSYMCLALGFIFTLASLKVLGESITEHKESGWKVTL